MRALLEAGSQLNVSSKDKYQLGMRSDAKLSPLCATIYYEQSDSCELLLASGADVSPKAICLEEEYESFEDLVGGLLDEDFSPAKNRILDVLLESPHTQDRVRQILQCQAVITDPIRNGEAEDDQDSAKVDRALVAAVIYRNATMTKWALDRGAHINSVSKDVGHGTPIYYAAQLGDSAIVQILLEAGADIHMIGSDGDSVFSYILRMHGQGYARELFGDTVDLELSPARKITIFRSACEKSNKALLEWILTTELDMPDNEAALKFDPVQPQLEPSILQAAIRYNLLSESERLRTFEMAWKLGLIEPLQLLVSDESIPYLRGQIAVPELTTSNVTVFHMLARRGLFDDTQLHLILSNPSIEKHPKLEKLIIMLLSDMEDQDMQGYLPIHRACLLRDSELVEALLRRGSSPNAQNVDSLRPLHLAAAKGGVDLIEVLVRYGADPDASDNDGSTALHHAAESWNAMEVCSKLLAVGANLDVQSKKTKMTPMHQAALKGRDDMLEVLLSSGANFALQDSLGHTPVHTAAKWIDSSCLQVFFSSQYMIGIDTMSQDGSSALFVAVREFSPEICKYLLKRGANVNHINSEGLTALHLAARWSSADVVRVLLEARATVTVIDRQGSTPLHLAVLSGDIESVMAILRAGASVADRDCNGYTPLLLAAANGHSHILEALLLNGADINAVLPGGQSSLHLALSGQHNYVTKLLVKHGSLINCVDNSGMSPLDVAQHYAPEAVVQYFVEISKEKGPRTGRQLGHFPPAPRTYQAAINGDLSVLADLAEMGQPLDIPDKSTGMTPLHYAVVSNNIDAVKWLHKHGVDMLATTRVGATILHLAAWVGAIEIFEYALKVEGLNSVAEDFFGTRPLHLGSAGGHQAIVNQLLNLESMNDDIMNSYADSYGTPLAIAAINGHIGIVKSLVNAAAQLNGRQSTYGPPLFAACAKGHQNIVHYLLANGASTSCDDCRFTTAIEIATKFKQLEIVDELEKFHSLSKNEKIRL